jgi:hypothetical protein
MTQFGQTPPPTKSQPNVYTVLLIIAILVMVIAVFLCYDLLTSPVAQGGYGLEPGDLLEPLKGISQTAD